MSFFTCRLDLANGSLNTASRETFLRASSCFPRVALRRNSDAGSHFNCGAYALAIRILSPGPKIITSSQCDRNRLSLCWQWVSAATSVSFCVFRLERSWNSESRDPNQRISPGHTVLSSVCIYHPRVDMLQNSVQPNQTCEQKETSAKQLPDRTVPL